MWKKVQNYIRTYGLLKPGDRVVAAVSGGADSVCLLSVLTQIRRNGLLTAQADGTRSETGIPDMELRAVHVHHGLRGAEADRDAAFVQQLCDRLEVPLVCVHRRVAEYAVEHGLSTEEAGRLLRYEALEQEAKRWKEEDPAGADGARSLGDVWIAVAHHQDDNAETILHHLLRGSGLKGLSGMRPKQGSRIRPLLCVNRKEILEYLRQEGLDWCEDSTNASLDYTRNRIRRELLPLMTQEVNARAVDNILHAGEIFAQADSYLEQQAAAVWASGGSVAGELAEGSVCAELRLEAFCGQPEIIRSYLIRHMLDLVTPGWKDITSRHFQQIAGLAEKQTGSSCDLPCGMRAVRGYGCLSIVRTSEKHMDRADTGIVLPLPEEPAVTVGNLIFCVFPRKKELEIPKNQYTKWFDYDKIKGTLSLRYRRTGDYLSLPGGDSKTIARYMIDEKIPREAREQIPVLAEEHHVLWVIGYRISEYYKITNTTKTILQVECNGGEEYGR